MPAFEAPSPGYFTVPLRPPSRTEPPDAAQGWWGEVRVRLVAGAPVHVGSGAPYLAGDRLIAGMTWHPLPDRRTLCVPGTSVKGSTRAVVEACSPSCDPLGSDRCGPAHRRCPACIVFGSAGVRGRLGFSDALMTAGGAAVERVAQRFSHRDAPARGRRLYRATPEGEGVDRSEDMEELLAARPDSVFEGSMSLFGVPDWGMGLVTLALGLGDSQLPWLRLGGGKNRGLGFAAVELDGGWVAETGRASVLGDRVPPGEVLPSWQEAAYHRFEDLRGRLEEIAEGYRS